MKELELIEALQREMHFSSNDIKAEVQMLLAIEKGLWTDQFITSCTNRFRREYSHDILSSDIREDANKQSLLEVHLTRGGIYDNLPEGLFFQGSTRRKATVSELSADYKTNKKKEADIRKFFQPFDHDYFLQRLSIEEEENLLLEGLQSGILNEYFIRFWNLPTSIPRPLLAPLILLLPFAYKIAGNLDLTASSLKQIFKEEVKVRRSRTRIHDASEINSPALGEGILGLDMVSGSVFCEDEPLFEIEIGPLQNSQVAEYLEGGHRYRLLETFNRFFVPVGVDTTIHVLVSPEKRNMILEKGAEPVLGYSSYI